MYFLLLPLFFFFFFFFNDTATTEIYTLPYTTLFRSNEPPQQIAEVVGDDPEQQPHLVRSEEHTSELQSRSDLVCRLLLEKKKKQHILTKSIIQNIQYTINQQ